MLRCVFRKLSQAFAMTLRRSDDLHLLPIIRKLFAAFEAHHVRSREHCGLRSPFCVANRYWKAVAGVPTAKKNIQKFSNHDPPSHT
jgi:hypothetical protein